MEIGEVRLAVCDFCERERQIAIDEKHEKFGKEYRNIGSSLWVAWRKERDKVGSKTWCVVLDINGGEYEEVICERHLQSAIEKILSAKTHEEIIGAITRD